MKRPPVPNRAPAAPTKAVYIRRRIAAVGVLLLGIATISTAVQAVSWASEPTMILAPGPYTDPTPTGPETHSVGYQTPGQTPGQTAGQKPSEQGTPQASPYFTPQTATAHIPAASYTATTAPKPKVTKPKKTKKKISAPQTVLVAGFPVSTRIHPNPTTLTRASKTKDTAKFPAGANTNANDRRKEWLNSDRTVKRGTPRAVAVGMVLKEGWSLKQWACLDRLWWHESGWNHKAGNKYGAYGIPQSLPGRKMRAAGSDWRTNPATQIEWGIDYIDERYGTPCAALNSWGKRAARDQGWY